MVQYYGQTRMTLKRFKALMHRWWTVSGVDPRIIYYIEQHDDNACRTYYLVATPELIARKLLNEYHRMFGDKVFEIKR